MEKIEEWKHGARVTDREAHLVSISWELDLGDGFVSVDLPDTRLVSSREGTDHYLLWEAAPLLGAGYRPTLTLRGTPEDDLSQGVRVTSEPFSPGESLSIDGVSSGIDCTSSGCSDPAAYIADVISFTYLLFISKREGIISGSIIEANKI